MIDSLSPNGYCAYLRKSRADQNTEQYEEVLKRHKRILLELAAKMQLKISKFYCEIVSGETISERPVMQKLLSDVEAKKWLGVFVVEIERLARGNTKDQGIVADAFQYTNTKIITPSKIYDPNNEFDEEYFEFGLFMSRREYKTINRRLMRGRISSIQEGKYIASTPPYGYKKKKLLHEKGYTLSIVPEEAEIVQQIFQWYCYGEYSKNTFQRLGANKIAAKLDAMHIKAPSSKNWSPSTIRDILCNKTYTGYIIFGRQKEIKSSINGEIIKIRKSNSNPFCEKGMHPPIISQQLFETAQQVRKTNQKNTVPTSYTLKNPLSGLIFCKNCKSAMTRLAPNSHTPYAVLKCPNRSCQTVSSPLFLVEEQLLSFLKDWLHGYELKYNISFLDSLPEINSKIFTIKKLEQNISSLEFQKEKSYDFLEQGIYTIDIFHSRQNILQNEITKLSNQLTLLKQQYLEIKQFYLNQQPFFPFISHLLETYQTNSISVNHFILQELVEKIYYQKEKPNHRGNLNCANFTLEIYPKLPKFSL